MKDDALRVVPFAEMDKIGGGKYKKGKSRALCRPVGFEMLTKHSG